MADDAHSDAATKSFASLGRGCLALGLIAAVLFFGLPSLIFRIESYNELTGLLILDAVIGAAIVGIVALLMPGLFHSRDKRRAAVVAVVLAVSCSGMMILWHSWQVYARAVLARPDRPAIVEDGP